MKKSKNIKLKKRTVDKLTLSLKAQPKEEKEEPKQITQKKVVKTVTTTKTNSTNNDELDNSKIYKFNLYRNKRFIDACNKNGITFQNNSGNNKNNEEIRFELLASTLIFRSIIESEINEKLNSLEGNNQVIKFYC